MRFAYFPGCSLQMSAVEYDKSTRAVFDALGIELSEIEDWNCCGATAAYAVDYILSLALPARNLAIAEREEMDILAPCAGCFHFLARANNILREKPNLKRTINQMLRDVDLEYKGNVKVRHPLDILINDFGLNKIKEKIKKPLKGLRVASYYGCLLLKPPSIGTFDSPENPQTLDKLTDALGATSVPWRGKTSCCGGALVLLKEDAMLNLCMKIFRLAQEASADCIITACPFCHFNLDVKQAEVNSAYGLNVYLPILYFTQLLGLALDISPLDLGLDKNVVPTTKIVKVVNQIV